MAAPVRNGIELDAVGELHVVLLVEPAALGVGPGCSPGVSIARCLATLDVAVVDELECLALG